MVKLRQSSLAQVLNLSGIELEKHVLVSELGDDVTLSDIEGLGWDVAFERKGGMLLMYRIRE